MNSPRKPVMRRCPDARRSLRQRHDHNTPGADEKAARRRRSRRSRRRRAEDLKTTSTARVFPPARVRRGQWLAQADSLRTASQFDAAEELYRRCSSTIRQRAGTRVLRKFARQAPPGRSRSGGDKLLRG